MKKVPILIHDFESDAFIPALGYRVTEFIGVVPVDELPVSHYCSSAPWIIYHLPTGIRFGVYADTYRVAKEYILNISKLNLNWESTDKAWTKGIQFDLLNKVGTGVISAEEASALMIAKIMKEE